MATAQIEKDLYITDEDNIRPNGHTKQQPIAAFSVGLRTSSTIGKLAEALAKAQADFKPVLKDCRNPYYNSKYADLSNVIEATRGALSKNGLVVLQSPRMDNEEVFLTTLLMHSSGEWISDDLRVPGTGKGKDGTERFDVQTVGSAITYARRYAYQSFVGVAAEEDDDGNAAITGREAMQRPAAHRPQPPAPLNEPLKITPTQRTMFWNAASEGNKTKDEVMTYFGSIGIEKTGEMLRKDFDAACKWAKGAA